MKKGFTIVEMTAAIALLAVCAVAFTQLVALVVSERVAARTRQTANDQVQNVLEYLAGTEPEKLATGDFDKTPFESLIERSLPDGNIVFETKPLNPDSVNPDSVNPERVIFIVTVSWDSGPAKDSDTSKDSGTSKNSGHRHSRREVTMFRLLHLSAPSTPSTSDNP